MRLAGLALVLALAGCHAKVGPGEHGWAEWDFWRGFNIDVQTGPPAVCLGCLELEEKE